MKHIYYGLGKGKTSTLNGSAIRANGAGKEVTYARFLKMSSSEDDILNKFTFFGSFPTSSRKFIWEMNEEERAEARQHMRDALFEQVPMMIETVGHKDMLILDEVTDLIVNKFITEEELIEFLETLPKDMEVLMSGHNKHPKLFEYVDLITYYEPQKHYFDAGVMARKGIEF